MLYLKSHCHTQSRLDRSPVLSFRSFIVLCFMFMSVIHFELIFMIVIRLGSICVCAYIFCLWIFSYSSTICWKGYFSTAFPLLLCQRSVCCIFVGLFLLFILFHWFMCSLFCQYHTVLITIACKSWSQQCQSSDFALLLHFNVGYSGSFASL